MVDVLTMGEALIRFTPPHHKRFEQTTDLEWFIGGSELNTSVGLARMGLDVGWLSRLTDNIMGRMVDNLLATQGITNDYMIWTDDARIGTYYMEEGIGSRPSNVTYDRAYSSMSELKSADLDLAMLENNPPRLFHTTGITLALSQTCAESVAIVWETLQQAGVALSFDFNYRSKLWDAESAKAGCEPYMQSADIIFIPARDAKAIYGTDALSELHGMFPQAMIVMTKGADGAEAITPDGAMHQHAIFPTETVCRVGGGDSFVAGFLYGYLNDFDVTLCLRYGAAVASLKYGLAGDMPLVELSQVESLVASDGVANISR